MLCLGTECSHRVLVVRARQESLAITVGLAPCRTLPRSRPVYLNERTRLVAGRNRLLWATSGPPRCKKDWVKARHTAPTAIGCRSSRGRSLMRRREFIAGLGSAAAWPIAARAQQGDRVRRIGVLMPYDENDPVAMRRLSAFTQTLADLGWTDGRNVRMDLRWGGDDTNRMRVFAQELVGLQPDIILTKRRPPPSSGRRGRSRSSLRSSAIPSPPALSLASTSQVGTSPASPPPNPRWQASGLSYSRKSRRGSSGL